MTDTRLPALEGLASWRRIAPAPAVGMTDAPGQIAALLVNGGCLNTLLDAAGPSRPLLVVNDPDRDTDTHSVFLGLDVALRTLGRIARFDLLIAAGSHRWAGPDRARFEERLLADCPLALDSISWHDATDAAELVAIGDGRFHRRLAQARAILAVGSVEPHYYAGLTGAHKTMTIGCAARDTIEANHAAALDPAAAPFRLEGNPVYDGIAAMARAVAAGRAAQGVNLVMRGDTLVDAAAGDWHETLASLSPAVIRLYAYRAERAADLLLLSARGALSRTLYQADKAIKNNEAAVRDGGAIILDAPCENGVGSAAFMELLAAAPTHAAAVAEVARRGYRLGDHKAVRLRRLTDPAARGVRLAVVSPHLTDAQVALIGGRRFELTDDACRWARAELPDSITAAIHVEDAANVAVIA